MQQRQEPTFELQTWTIPPEKISAWRRLQPTFPKEQAIDCTINVLRFLGVIENPDFAEALAEEKNTKRQGTNPNEALSYIFLHFNKEEYKVNHALITPADPYAAVIAALTHDNMYTLGWLGRGHGVIGHSVVIARINGELYILDPQQQSGYCGLVAIRQYFDEQRIEGISYIYKSISKPVRNRTETATQIRRQEKLSPPSKKSRTHSPSSKKGGKKTIKKRSKTSKSKPKVNHK
jgi:hypothetical protein